MHYDIGDTVTYQPFGGGERTVLVTEKADIKDGRPGFGGTMSNGQPEVWGYDDQITSVVTKR